MASPEYMPAKVIITTIIVLESGDWLEKTTWTAAHVGLTHQADKYEVDIRPDKGKAWTENRFTYHNADDIAGQPYTNGEWSE